MCSSRVVDDLCLRYLFAALPRIHTHMGNTRYVLGWPTTRLDRRATTNKKTQCGAEYARGKDDVYNTAVGACLAGGAAGLKTKKISHMCAGCLGMAVVLSAVRLG